MLIYSKRKVLENGFIFELQEIAKESGERKFKISPKDYPDIQTKVLSLVPSIEHHRELKEYYVREMWIEKLATGAQIKKGTDVLDPKATTNNKIRDFTVRTVIKREPSVKGGTFVIYTQDGYIGDVPLEEGDSLIYRSSGEYQVLKVEEGEVYYLLAYIHKHG